MQQKTNIGIIGYGTMGCAIARQLCADYTIFSFDKDLDRRINDSNIHQVDSLQTLAKSAKTIIVAVKPQDAKALFIDLDRHLDNHLIISIAAGITTKSIENILNSARIIRVMPNVGVQVGEGMSCLCKGRSASEEDLAASQKIFDSVGKTLIIDETQMDEATAIAGSGPAYLCFYSTDWGKAPAVIRGEFSNSLQRSAQTLGFGQKDALRLAQTTTDGTIKVLNVTGQTPQQLQQKVTSKGGTTEAALQILRGGGSLDNAVRAAVARAKELGKKNEC